MSFDFGFFWRQLLEPSELFLRGLLLTLGLSAASQLLGSALGLGLALARLAPLRPLRWLAGGYVFALRGTPLLVQIVFLYTGLAAAGLFRFQDLQLGPLLLPGNVQAGIVALSLNEAAYMAEILRAAIGAVDPGQSEAARALGMTPALRLRRIVLPQALRTALPPLGNEFNAMLKNSALVSAIGVPELLLVTETLTSATFRVFELYAVVALYYLALTALWACVQRWLEARFAPPGAAPARGAPRLAERWLGGAALRVADGR
jgi:polar amino acid transport system permease protein